MGFAAFTAHDLPEGMEPNLQEQMTFDPVNFAFPFGTHVAVVEVDTDTGYTTLRRYVAVDDCGNQVNPLIVEGQVHGGVVQGVAQALWAHAIYDADGNPTYPSLLDYLVPSAAEVPMIETDFTVTPSTSNPLGVKGVGEAGTIGSLLRSSTPSAMRSARSVCTTSRCLRRRGRCERSSPRRRVHSHDPRSVRLRPGRIGRRGPVALAEHGDDAKVLAGGHSLIPLMRFRLVTPGVIVDVGGLNGDLRGISVDGDTVTIGAMTRHSELEHSAELAVALPLLAHVASLVGDPAVRHRGTLGGSIAHADPASDLPAAMIALGATLVALGPAGEREIAIDDFFTGFLESSLAANELLTAVKIPVSTGGWAYEKFNRRAQDWAVVGVAVAGGASATDAAATAPEGASPPTDTNGDAAYRNHLAQVLTERALSRAMA